LKPRVTAPAVEAEVKVIEVEVEVKPLKVPL